MRRKWMFIWELFVELVWLFMCGKNAILGLVWRFFLCGLFFVFCMSNIVFVGVGWAWMSAIARLFLSLWFSNLVGIDSSESELTKKLWDEWLKVIIGHGQYEVQQRDFVIYSAAAMWSPEVIRSEELSKLNKKIVFPPLSYFEFLWEISKYFSTIAIAWTHGKSTTTALTAKAAKNLDPDFWLWIVWAWLADWEWANLALSNTHRWDIKNIISHIVHPKWPKVEHLMKKYRFYIEACEYNYQFLSLDVDYACITNIELDHADVYGTFENYIKTFETFCGNLRKWVFFFDDVQGRKVLGTALQVPTTLVEKSTFNFTTLLWNHNHLNASMASAVLNFLLPEREQEIQSEIESFTWLWRRGEVLTQNTHWVDIISDYAHHPTELAHILTAVEEKYEWPVTLIFQAHQARRVVEFWDEFVWVMQGREHVHLYRLYTAREKIHDLATYDIVSEVVTSAVPDLKDFRELWDFFADYCNATYTEQFTDIVDIIDSVDSWVVLVCSAWDIDRELRQHLWLV